VAPVFARKHSRHKPVDALFNRASNPRVHTNRPPLFVLVLASFFKAVA